MWAQGWMSAANEDALGHDLKPVDLSAMSEDEQLAITRQYCDENPLRTYGDAVVELYGRLNSASAKP